MSFTALDVQGRPLHPDADLVLHHEHLFCDITCWVRANGADPDSLPPVAEANLDDVRARPWVYPDNMRLDDAELVRQEVAMIPARRAAIVDVTPVDIGRSPRALRDFAASTDVQVFMGCGHYVEAARSGETVRDPAFYRDEILADLLEGVSGARAAVIGEIGTSNPISPLEEATLRGAAQAQARTGAALYVHVELWNPAAVEALDLVEAEGADLSRVVLCHLDCSLLVHELSYHAGVLERGAMIAFDTWGDELEYDGNRQPSDEQRIESLLALADRGFGDRILHSHDICTKTQLSRFGGPGYRHLPAVVFPRFRARGFSDADVRTLFLEPALTMLAV